MGRHFVVPSHRFAVGAENQAGIPVTVRLFIIFAGAKE